MADIVNFDKRKELDGRRPLLGRWVCVDDWDTNIALTVEQKGTDFSVRATDETDGEEAEIYGIEANEDGLSFAAYWSSGRFTKYRIRPVGPDQIEVIFTYTETTHFKRAPADREE